MSEELFVMPDGWANKRKTDEPPPMKPECLWRQEFVASCIEDIQNRFEECAWSVEQLAERGITVDLTFSATTTTTDKDAEIIDQYRAEYAAWEKRNPIVEYGILSRLRRSDTPLIEMITKSDPPKPGTVTWGYSSPGTE